MRSDRGLSMGFKVVFFMLLVLTFYGGYRFLFDRGIAVIPASLPNVSCIIGEFSPPIKIKIEEVKISVDGEYKPLSTLYGRNGNLVGYWDTTRNFKKDGVVDNLTERWWRKICKSVGDFVLYTLYADESHIFLLTANRHFATAKVQNYCLYWSNVEKGNILERFRPDKKLSQNPLLKETVLICFAPDASASQYFPWVNRLYQMEIWPEYGRRLG